MVQEKLRPERAKAFALTARKPHTNALNTQGVALGWWLLALQAVYTLDAILLPLGAISTRANHPWSIQSLAARGWIGRASAGSSRDR